MGIFDKLFGGKSKAAEPRTSGPTKNPQSAPSVSTGASQKPEVSSGQADQEASGKGICRAFCDSCGVERDAMIQQDGSFVLAMIASDDQMGKVACVASCMKCDMDFCSRCARWDARAFSAQLRLQGKSDKEIDDMNKDPSFAQIKGPVCPRCGGFLEHKTNADGIRMSKLIEELPEMSAKDQITARNRFIRIWKEERQLFINAEGKDQYDAKLIQLLMEQGSTLGQLGRSDEQIKCYDEALRIDPRCAKAWNNKGAICHGKGQSDKAIECFDKALGIDPCYVNSLVGKGQALWQSGKQDEARELFKKAIKLKPEMESKLSAYLGP